MSALSARFVLFFGFFFSPVRLSDFISFKNLELKFTLGKEEYHELFQQEPDQANSPLFCNCFQQDDLLKA